ncbi:hypothetical protein KIL84_018396 [Mauremys mutica]|uniref:Uncharacterized protein n=1 Tax=Mauremys mutica TaxID=74926 RepID=A0A9D3XT85_9SAUR|nr:hypothetical protein KIL84_018396 [Mauremys mutica]
MLREGIKGDIKCNTNTHNTQSHLEVLLQVIHRHLLIYNSSCSFSMPYSQKHLRPFMVSPTQRKSKAVTHSLSIRPFSCCSPFILALSYDFPPFASFFVVL